MSAVTEPRYTLEEWRELMPKSGAELPRLYEERPEPNGYVYFVQMGDDGPIKVGFSINVQRRMESLQSCNPEQIHLRLALPGSVWDEEDYQGDFHRSHIRGEWFRPTDDLLAFIRQWQDEDEADLA